MLLKPLALVLFLVVFSAGAQPNTDIVLYDVNWDKKTLANGTNLTHYKGYDNQPFFSPGDERIYFTRIINNQADAYYYDTRLKVVREFRNTPESEYSPTVTPDGQFIAVIQVEQDSSQRLWKFPIDGGEPSLIFEQLEPVGYQAWSDPNTVAMFVLGDPNSLYLGNTTTQSVKRITENIGRSLHHHEGSIYFVHKESEERWWIKKLDLTSQKITGVVETLPGREDFTVTSSGKILMGDGSDIYLLKSGKWKRTFKLDGEYRDFNRLALSSDEKQLALVVVIE